MGKISLSIDQVDYAGYKVIHDGILAKEAKETTKKQTVTPTASPCTASKVNGDDDDATIAAWLKASCYEIGSAEDVARIRTWMKENGIHHVSELKR